jgi:ribonucleoside-diphosphate reductase beta chain
MLDWTDSAEQTPSDLILTPPPIREDSDATGLGKIARGAARVRVDDKAMINCRADVNQLLPLKYRWAWEKYLSGCTGCRRRSRCRPTSLSGKARTG